VECGEIAIAAGLRTDYQQVHMAVQMVCQPVGSGRPLLAEYKVRLCIKNSIYENVFGFACTKESSRGWSDAADRRCPVTAAGAWALRHGDGPPRRAVSQVLSFSGRSSS
jgi:hypothetical protein